MPSSSKHHHRRHTYAYRLIVGAGLVPLHAHLSTAQTAQELPPIVVESATLAKPKPTKKPTSAAKAEPEPAPAQKPTAPPANVPAGPASEEAAESQAQEAPAQAEGISPETAGSAITVVTKEELQAEGTTRAVDALRSLPGVSVSGQGTPSNLTVVRIRGAESNHTLVMIDGVEVNPVGNDGFFDFANIGVDDIEQIEVLRGVQSGLHGTGAIGGVINIVTKSGKGQPLTLSARAEGGGFGTKDGAIGLSGGNDHIWGSVTLAGKRSDGFNISTVGGEDDRAELSSFSVRGGVQVVDGLTLDGTLRMSRNKGDRDGFGLDVQGFSVPVDDKSFFESPLWVGRFAATLDTFDDRWTHKFEVSRAETGNQDTDATFGTFLDSTSETFKYGYTSSYRLEEAALPGVRHYFTGLLERTSESFEQDSPISPSHERDRTSLAGEIRGEYFDTLFLTGTVRQDRDEAFGDFTTWHGAAALKVPSTPFRLHGSAGTGIKFPSLSEQFGTFAFFVPNPALAPERAFGWDGGLETTVLDGGASLDVTYFNADLSDEIDTVFVAPFSFTSVNRTGKSLRSGIEVAGRVAVTDGLTLGAAYTFLDATEDDGRKEVRRPPHSGRLDLNYAWDGGRGKVNVAAVYNGHMRDIAFNAFDPTLDRVDLKPYWLVGALASYEIAPGVSLFARGENLLNQNYQEVFGFETAGAAAYAGLRLELNERVAGDAKP